MKTLAEYPVDHLDYSTNFIEMNNSLIVQGNIDINLKLFIKYCT